MATSVTATFVFTDMVDSTATAARLGPEAADELRQAHFHLLRGAVLASGGAEVKNLGDGLMVVYSSPSRALSGAVGMQQAIERHNRSGGHPLAVRVGISVGEAVEEDADYFGDPVTEAARLCAAAQGGQILAADVVRVLLGRHAAQTFVEVEPLALKGIPEPVATVEVVWEPANVAGSVPLPGRLVGAAADALFGFFGRGRELAALEEARKRAHGSRRVLLVLVSGEAGMGKTALVAQASRSAHAEGSVVLFGHADEDLGVAYQPWVEVLDTLVRHGDPALVEGLPAAQRAALARLVPEVADDGAVRVADPDLERLLLLEAATGLLAAASRQAPLLVVLDDVHWADTATLQLLRHMVTSTAAMDAVVACTYRGTDLRRGDPLTNLLADLHREASVARIELDGLDDAELVELMEAAAGHVLDDSGVGLAHALRRETDGNPFFTGEILRHLGESGGIVLGSDGRWTVAGELADLGLPQSVHDVVGRRVERLGDEAVRVLRLAAVIGREFDVELLARVAEVQIDPLLDVIDAATSAAVLVEGAEPERYRFAHALIQHTLYDELSPVRRQRAHHRVAEALETGAPNDDASRLAELAHHWVAATRPAELEKALGYVLRAGDAARDALAPDDAIRWYKQALDLIERHTPPDEHRRARLLAALGTAQREAAHSGYYDSLLDAATLAEQVDDVDVLVQAALGFNLGLTGIHRAEVKARHVIEAALDRVGANVTPARARLLAELATTYDTGTEWQATQRMSSQAIELARQANNDTTFVQVLRKVYFSVLVPDQLGQRIQDIEMAAAIADRSGDPALRFQVRELMMWVAYERADAAQADAVVAEMERLAEAIGLPDQRWEAALYVAGRELMRGAAEHAEAANEYALSLGLAAGVPLALAQYGGVLFAIRQHQGRIDEVAEVLIEAARDNPSLPALRSVLPAMLCEIDRLDEARDLFATERLNGFDYPYDTTWLAAMGNLTDTAATLKDRAACTTLITRLQPFAHQVIVPTGVLAAGALGRSLGRAATLLGQYDQAEQWFAGAHDLHHRLEAPYWSARGQLDHAGLCLARRAEGDVARARELAITAAATAAEYGCAALSRRAATLLAT